MPKRKRFYNDMDEYRWEYPHVGQGHYILASDDSEAEDIAVKEARQIGLGSPINLQRFKPTKGRKKRIHY